MEVQKELIQRLLVALQDALGGTSYFGEDDSVGTRVCCGVASYKNHDKTCELHNVYVELRGLPR